MWQNNKIFTRSRIGLILFLLITIRLVPFNLLHYHNNQFASFAELSRIAGQQSTEETISDDAPYCAFHQFLSLINNSFVLDLTCELTDPDRHDIVRTAIIVSTSTFLFFDILNKGSPLLV